MTSRRLWSKVEKIDHSCKIGLPIFPNVQLMLLLYTTLALHDTHSCLNNVYLVTESHCLALLDRSDVGGAAAVLKATSF